jgi:hypothetical protein
MRPVYLRNESNGITRKIMLDMAYLSSHKKIRLPKWFFEENLYFLFKNKDNEIEKYFLSKEKVFKEDENHFFFNFPFKTNQVEDISV